MSDSLTMFHGEDPLNMLHRKCLQDDPNVMAGLEGFRMYEKVQTDAFGAKRGHAWSPSG